MGDVFWRHLFVWVAYLQDGRQLAWVSPEEFVFARLEQRLPFTLLVGNPPKQVASDNVSHFEGSDNTVMSPFFLKTLQLARMNILMAFFLHTVWTNSKSWNRSTH